MDDQATVFWAASFIYLKKGRPAAVPSREMSHVGSAIITLRTKDGALLARISMSEVKRVIDKRQVPNMEELEHLYSAAMRDESAMISPRMQIASQKIRSRDHFQSILNRVMPKACHNQRLIITGSVIIGLALAAASLTLPTAYDKHLLRQMARRSLKDPSSALFGEIVINRRVELTHYPQGTFDNGDAATKKMEEAERSGTARRTMAQRACVFVNAKNSLGGYTGERVFLFQKDEGKPWVMTSTADDYELWGSKEWCDMHIDRSQ